MGYFTGYFLDAGGVTCPVHINAPAEANAKDFLNKMAAKSRAKWNRLTTLEAVTVDAGVFTSFNVAAANGSTVATRAKGVYNSSVARNTIGVTIPAPKDSVVTEGARETTTDPLSGTEKGKLRSEGGATATTLRQYRYNEKLNKE